jgi:amidase
MTTTAGSLSMTNCTPTQDATIIRQLRSHGALILGKVPPPNLAGPLTQNHLSEFALQGLSRSSLGGQVLNPYDVSRTPGGSSGGTGAAIAANFAVIGIGTDTMNSVPLTRERI